MSTQISEYLESNDTNNNKKHSPSERVGKWITTATAAILLSACAAPHRNPDVVVIRNTPYNSSLSVYERERVLDGALRDTRRERELIEEQRRLDEQRTRNRIKEYRDQQRLHQKTQQFNAEQGRTVIIAPATQYPTPRKPVSIYPDTHPHGNTRY